MPRTWTLALPIALALTACQPPMLTSQGGGMIESRVGGVGARLAPKIVVAGLAQAPAGVIANAGASVIANGGGSVIANGGGSILANGGAMFKAPAFALLAAEALAPVADAEVVLLAADGRPFPGVAPSKTDALGKFSLANVPEGSVGFVEIRGKGFRLGRLMKAAANEALRVDPVSTAVADGVRAQLKDPKALAQIEPGKLKALEDAVQAASDAGEIQIDLKQGGSAEQALAKALEKRPEAAQAARTAVAEATKAAAEAPAADAAQPAAPARPAAPTQPGDGTPQPATPAEPAAPAQSAAGGDQPAPPLPDQAATPPAPANGGDPGAPAPPPAPAQPAQGGQPDGAGGQPDGTGAGQPAGTGAGQPDGTNGTAAGTGTTGAGGQAGGGDTGKPAGKGKS